MSRKRDISQRSANSRIARLRNEIEELVTYHPMLRGPVHEDEAAIREMADAIENKLLDLYDLVKGEAS